MKCEKCQDRGYIELDEIGLQCQICDCEAGKAYMERLGLTMPTIEESTTVEIAGASLKGEDDSINGIEPDNRDTGSGDTSEPKQPKKPKAKKRARRKSK